MFNFFRKKQISSKEVKDDNSEKGKDSKVKTLMIRYSYEWIDNLPDEEKTPCNPFCQVLMESDKLFSRADIETLSTRMGYSVFDRCGAYIDLGDEDENGNPIQHPYIKDGVEQEHCKHQWKSKIVTRK